MINRDVIKDLKHAEPLTALSDPEVRVKLANSPRIWHALWLPPGLLQAYEASTTPGLSDADRARGAVVFTGHINCHDCALCSEAGAYPHEGWKLVPWRRVYADCTDDPGEEDAALAEERSLPGDDDLACVPDPVVGSWRPTEAELRALRLGLVNPAPGVYLPTGVKLSDPWLDLLDSSWMGSPAGSCGQLTPFTLAADMVAGGQGGTIDIPAELRAWLEAPLPEPEAEAGVTQSVTSVPLPDFGAYVPLESNRDTIESSSFSIPAPTPEHK